MLHPYFVLEVTAEDLSALYCKYTKMEMFLSNGTVHHLGQLLHWFAFHVASGALRGL